MIRDSFVGGVFSKIRTQNNEEEKQKSFINVFTSFIT